MFTHTISIAILVLTAATLAEVQAAPFVTIDKIAAVVGNDAILLSHVDRIAPSLDPNNKINVESRRRALDALINRTLIIRAAADAGLVVTEIEVEQAFQSVLTQNNELSMREMQEELARQGYTDEIYRQELRAQLLRLKAANHFVRPHLVIGDDEIRAHYQHQKKDQPGLRSQKELRAIIYSELVESGMREKTSEWIDELRKEAIIDVRL